MIYFFLSTLLSVLLMLMSVALVTLLERKVLALSQFRLGPNKVLFKGVLQPVLDGVKLFQKSMLLPFQAFSGMIMLGPSVVLGSMIMLWSTLFSFPLHSSLWLSSFLFLLVLGLSVYGVLLTGLGGASKYSFLGGIRACIQSISYEISFALVIFSIIVLMNHVAFSSVSSLLLCVVFPIWGFSVVAETNRAPFDLAEGESELISGFNLELGSVFLALVFVGEYGMVIIFAWLTSLFFLSGSLWAVVLWILFSLLFRSVLPRFRYDKLLSFCWASLLPPSVMWMLLSLVLSSV